MKNYKAILFDMDGVIVDSMLYHAMSWKQVFHDYGILLSEGEIYQREGMSGISSIKDIFIDKGFDLPDEDELKDFLEKKLFIFENYNISVFPVVREILELLHKKELKMALVTGSMRRSVAHVLPEDIIKYFSAIVTVDDINNGKPDPEPYIHAMSLLGSNPEDSLVVENAPLGIISAKRAGLNCFAVETTLSESYLNRADKIFKSHKSLFDYFRRNL